MSLRKGIFLLGMMGIFAMGVVRADKLPIALVGDGYGEMEIKHLIKNVFDIELVSELYENRGANLPASEFANYRLVIIAGMLSEFTYSAEDTHTIAEYVRNGGRLLMIQQAPKNFTVSEDGVDRGDNYIFGRSYYQRDGVECMLLDANSPLLEGVFDAFPEPFWLNGSVLLKSLEWTSLVGNENFILVGAREMEKGKVYYLGHESFRLTSKAKQEGLEDQVQGWFRLIVNIIRDENGDL